MGHELMSEQSLLANCHSVSRGLSSMNTANPLVRLVYWGVHRFLVGRVGVILVRPGHVGGCGSRLDNKWGPWNIGCIPYGYERWGLDCSGRKM